MACVHAHKKAHEPVMAQWGLIGRTSCPKKAIDPPRCNNSIKVLPLPPHTQIQEHDTGGQSEEPQAEIEPGHDCEWYWEDE